MRPDLTVNLGLRYERETGTVERHDRTLVGFDDSSANSVTAAARAAYAANPLPDLPASAFNPVGGPIFASSSHRAIYSTPGDAFSPRLGVAYTPATLGGNTVFRGGFGIFYDTYGTTGVQQPGFSQSTPFVPTLDGFLTPATTLSNPFPAGVLQPVGAARGLDQNLGQGLTYTNTTLAQPYSRRYTAGVQQRARFRHRRSRRPTRSTSSGPAGEPGAELHAGELPQHLRRPRSGDDQPAVRQRPQPVPGAAARDDAEWPDDHLRAAAAGIPAVHVAADHDRQRRHVGSAHGVADGAEAFLRAACSCWRPTRDRR